MIPMRHSQPGEVLGIGVDLVSVARVGNLAARFGDRFLKRIYTPDEILESRGRAVYLAGRFGVKESLLKALGTGLSGGLRWTEIATRSKESGAPYVTCRGGVYRMLEEKGVRDIWVSISHERESVVSMVVLTGGTEG